MKLRCIEVAQAAGLQCIKKTGSEVLFTCPRHDDKHPSLNINPDKNAWLCRPCGKSGNAWELAAFILDVNPDDKAKLAGWLREKGLLSDNGNQSKQFVCAYIYEDENRTPLFRTEKYMIPGGKTFLQSRAAGNGSWIGGKGCMCGVRLVPYRLPDWINKPTVYIPEGEKDVDNLWKWNLPATTNPMGAGNWREEFNQFFKGKRVVILADNDEPGERHVRKVAQNLLPIAQAVKIVRLHGLPLKGDVSDWIAAGGTREPLVEIIKATDPLSKTDVDSWAVTKQKSKRFASVAEVPGLGDIPDVRVDYLVDGFIPKASVTVIAGAPGSLKSFLALDISRCLAGGRRFAGRTTTQCDVLYIDRENPASVIRQRTKTLAIENHRELHYWGLWCDETPPPLGEPRVIDFARSEANKCIVYDSLIRFHHADENDATEMGKVMGELRQLAATGATVLVLLHKSDKSENNYYRGSSEILAGCDVMWSIEKQPDNKTIELKAVKNRYCEETKFALRLEDGGFVEAETAIQAEGKTALQIVEALVSENPGATKSRLEDMGTAKGLTRQQVRSALENERFTTIPGLHNSKGYYFRSETTEGYALEV